MHRLHGYCGELWVEHWGTVVNSCGPGWTLAIWVIASDALRTPTICGGKPHCVTVCYIGHNLYLIVLQYSNYPVISRHFQWERAVMYWVLCAHCVRMVLLGIDNPGVTTYVSACASRYEAHIIQGKYHRTRSLRCPNFCFTWHQRTKSLFLELVNVQ